MRDARFEMRGENLVRARASRIPHHASGVSWMPDARCRMPG
jgi:hypothetical protein